MGGKLNEDMWNIGCLMMIFTLLINERSKRVGQEEILRQTQEGETQTQIIQREEIQMGDFQEREMIKKRLK